MEIDFKINENQEIRWSDYKWEVLSDSKIVLIWSIPNRCKE